MKTVAFYLPQFHTIPENDRWWYEGFTEWTVLEGSKPLFRDHDQPVRPGELGRYSLLNEEIHRRQAELASQYGVNAFCYWTYWSEGERLLEQPLDLVESLSDVPIEYCLGWANHDWTRVWQGNPRDVLRRQRYGGENDAKEIYRLLQRHFRSSRYLRVEGRPVVFIYRPMDIEALHVYRHTWDELSDKSGDERPLLVGEVSPAQTSWPSMRFLDSYTVVDWVQVIGLKGSLRKRMGRGPAKVDARRVPRALAATRRRYGGDPWLLVGWDNTPRRGRGGWLVQGDTQAMIRDQVEAIALELHSDSDSSGCVWIKSWNEWSEGNQLEPTASEGRSRLEALASADLPRET